MSISYSQHLIDTIMQDLTQGMDYGKVHSKGVYLIRNKITNEVYIGGTNNRFNFRWRQHVKFLVNNSHFNQRLQDSWNEYSYHDFEFKVIKSFNCKCTNQEIANSGQEQIAFHLYNNIQLFNCSSLDTGNGLLSLDSKDKFKQLMKNLLLKYDLDCTLADEMADCTVEEIQMFVECIGNITNVELEGVNKFLYMNQYIKYDVFWNGCDFNISTCALERCVNYDSLNYYCKLQNASHTEGGLSNKGCSKE